MKQNNNSKGAVKTAAFIADKLGAWILLIVIALIMIFANDKFLTGSNIINVLRQISVVTIAAVGVSLIILGGGIYAAANLFYYILVIIRKQEEIFFVYAAGALLAFFAAPAAVKGFGIDGAAFSYMCFMLVLAAGFALLCGRHLKEERKTWDQQQK